ncbi:MAG: flagellar filament capping protein FliD [Campylobacterales bacterium]|nr:flagellar filament capping protein FliD [Campylobacterales bacterium]
MAVISSLGIGSGVLTADVIDQLKESDRSMTVTPLDNKIELNTKKESAMELLESLTSTLRSSAFSMKDSSLYQKREVSGANDGIEVTANDGVDIHDFSISDVKLAHNNVIQSGEFADRTNKVATGAGTLNININGNDYKIEYDADTSYEDLMTKINDTAGEDLTASILQISDNSYSFVINSKETGKDQQIVFSDLSGNLKDTLKSDTNTSGTFSLSSSKIATGDGSLTLSAGGEEFTFDYDSFTTLGQLADMINEDENASKNVFASVIKSGDNLYNLVLAAKGAAEGSEISIVDNSGMGYLDSKIVSSDVSTSEAFASNTDLISSGGAGGTLTLNTSAGTYDFAYDATTTLEDLANAINLDATASQNVQASVEQNENGTYNLVLKSINDAAGSGITITDAGDLDAKLLATGGGSSTTQSGDFTDVQTSSDASFKYNGITLTRSSNTIDDIKFGLEIKLLEDDASANISITQDAQPIKDEMQVFADSYNSLQKQISAMTLADVEAGTTGLFNGDSSINSISRALRDLLTSSDPNTGIGLAQYGFELDQSGTLSFNSSNFDEMMDKSPEGLADFFSGKTTVIGEFDDKKDAFLRFAEDKGISISTLITRIDNGTYTLTDKLFENEEFTFDDIKDYNSTELTTYQYMMDSTTHDDGIFEKIYTNLKDLTSMNGVITSVNNGLSREGTLLEESRTRALEQLTSKYDTMSARFVQYDSIINQLNNQFSVLQQQIAMAING